MLHQIDDAATIARSFENPRRQHRNRLGIVETQATRATLTREFGRDVDEKLLLLVRRDQHARIIAWGHRVGQT